MKRISAFLLALCLALGVGVVSAAPSQAVPRVMPPDGYAYVPCSNNVDVWYWGKPQLGDNHFSRNAFCLQQTLNGVNHKLVYQTDGNLVAYRNGVAYWSSGTADRGGRLHIQGDGNIVIYNRTATAAIWQSGTYGPPGEDNGRLLAVGMFGNQVCAAVARYNNSTGKTTSYAIWQAC